MFFSAGASSPEHDEHNSLKKHRFFDVRPLGEKKYLACPDARYFRVFGYCCRLLARKRPISDSDFLEGHREMLIKDAHERTQRALKNRTKLWDFLSIHTYSDLETLTHHMAFATKAPVSKILKHWVAIGIVKKIELKNSFGKVTLFGITQKGIENDRKPVQPSKISLRTLEHTLKVQRASSYFLQLPKTEELCMEIINIESGDLKKYGLSHRPDLLMQSALDETLLVCIEVELSLKSYQRYVEILKTYFAQIRCGHINQVIYVFYDSQVADRFEKTILHKYYLKYPDDIKQKLKVKVLK